MSSSKGSREGAAEKEQPQLCGFSRVVTVFTS
jgi:hypothetical protein